MTTTLIIDADMTLFQASQVTEHAVDWGDDLWVMWGNLAEARDLVTNQLERLKERFNTNTAILCLSDPSGENFRKSVDPTYKSNRKSSRKPMIYPELRKWLIEELGAIHRPTLEGDDLCGIYATDPKTTDPVIISDDKDMLTIPGVLWRLDVLHQTDEAEAYRHWMKQALTGDPTDGYKGCPGCGPVGAEKALGKHATFGKVVAAYEKKGLTYNDALTSARLARILHYNDWDADTQTVRLWEPTDKDMIDEPETDTK